MFVLLCVCDGKTLDFIASGCKWHFHFVNFRFADLGFNYIVFMIVIYFNTQGI